MNYDNAFKQEYEGQYGEIKKELKANQVAIIDERILSFESILNATLPELDKIVELSIKIKGKNRLNDYEEINKELGQMKGVIEKVFQNMDAASIPLGSMEIEPETILKDDLTSVAFPTVEFIKVNCKKEKRQLIQIKGLSASLLAAKTGMLGNADAYVVVCCPSATQEKRRQKLIMEDVVDRKAILKTCQFPNVLGVECMVKTSHGNATVTMYWNYPEIIYEDLDSAGLLCRSTFSIMDLVYDSNLGKLLYIPKEGGGVRKLYSNATTCN